MVTKSKVQTKPSAKQDLRGKPAKKSLAATPKESKKSSATTTAQVAKKKKVGTAIKVGDDLFSLAAKIGAQRGAMPAPAVVKRKAAKRVVAAAAAAAEGGSDPTAAGTSALVAELASVQARHSGAAANAKSKEQETREIVKRAVAGASRGPITAGGGAGGSHAAALGFTAGSSSASSSFLNIDPLSTSGLAMASTPFLNDYAAKRAEECANEDTLLASAHEYFSKLNRMEKSRNKEAMRKIREMKAVNKQGGDKDGFQYVLPTNTKKFVTELASREANGGAVIDGDMLESNFRGDGEKDEKPMRRTKERKHFRDDFYAFQVAKKWTKNAESFLARGRAHRDMFAVRSKLRNPNKL